MDKYRNWTPSQVRQAAQEFALLHPEYVYKSRLGGFVTHKFEFAGGDEASRKFMEYLRINYPVKE